MMNMKMMKWNMEEDICLVLVLKKTQKHVGSIVVKGRKHHVFKGTAGGLYYLKGKTGRKVYIDMSRLKKK